MSVLNPARHFQGGRTGPKSTKPVPPSNSLPVDNSKRYARLLKRLAAKNNSTAQYTTPPAKKC